MKIAISTESTLDLPKEMIEEFQISTIPFEFTVDDKTYFDGELSTEEMFDIVDKTGKLPKTMAINSYKYKEYFEGLLNDADAVIHIVLSSGISCSCNNAISAANELKNVFIVDSLSLSTGIALLAIYARGLANEGLSPKKIHELVQARAKKLQVSFCIERLDYLHKGGRCSSMALFGANLLKIRPRIVVSNETGSMSSDKKYRGKMGAVVEKYCQDTLADFNTPDKSLAFITYTTATDEMLDAARRVVKEAGFERICETKAGGTIACHCGAHTLGLLYFNDGNEIKK